MACQGQIDRGRLDGSLSGDGGILLQLRHGSSVKSRHVALVHPDVMVYLIKINLSKQSSINME
jgi:hypothetical protein